eukprot:1140741-Pelagomonas_calceolata.AAC.1
MSDRAGHSRSSAKATQLKMPARRVSVTFRFGMQLCWYPRFPGAIKGVVPYRARRGRELHVIRITDITDRRSTIGPSSLFNSESVYPQPESGSVAKDMMGKIQ